MSNATITVTDRCRTVWLMRIQSAFRTAVACTIVGCATLYGPDILKRNIKFSAFSYLTAILIVCDQCDCNLGNAIKGCCYAFYATIQVVPLTVLSISIIGRNQFFPSVAAVAAAIMSFVVALPQSTPLMTKRIAFGQVVIVYVATVIHRNDEQIDIQASWRPVHVAYSTTLGAISALLAMLLPCPRLAYCEVKKLRQLYTEGVTERMNLYKQALAIQTPQSAAHFIAKAQPLAHVDKKILRSIALIQEGIVWERPWMRLSKRHESVSPIQRLQAMETPMRGMKIALEATIPPLTTNGSVHISEAIDNLQLCVSTLLNLKPRQQCFTLFTSTTDTTTTTTTTAPEFKTCKINLPYDTILSIYQDLPACFFLSCAQQFMLDLNTRQSREEQLVPLSWDFKIQMERLIFAIKCSISLGLAVLFGLLFNRRNGYWSGLIVAISFVEGRQALFTVANARAQGTALGSAYGVVGCFLFKMFPKLRFLALFPWILFTRFLMHSKMYSQAGGTSAVIGALLILGRNNYGLPNEFAIARLTEAILGLFCFILIELVFQPTKSSTLAKKQLYLSLLALQGCIQQLLLSLTNETQSSSSLHAFKDKIKSLNSQVQDLQNFIQEAEIEPTFSFLPFPGSNYTKLHHSLSNMTDILSCMTYSLEYMLQVSRHLISPWKEIQGQLKKNLELCNETLNSSLKCLEKISQVPQEKGTSLKNKWNKGIEQTINNGCSFHQDSKEVQDSCIDIEDEDELKAKMLVSLSSLVFCTSYMIKETKAINRRINKLINWEYPSNQQ